MRPHCWVVIPLNSRYVVNRQLNLPALVIETGTSMQTLPTAHSTPEFAARRPFKTVLSVLLAAAIVSGCGSSPTRPTGVPAPNPPTTTGNVIGTVASNHERPHVAVITAAQLAEGTSIVIDISNGLHSHTVIVTSGEVEQIAVGIRVSVTSTTNPHSNGMDPHNHGVTFN